MAAIAHAVSQFKKDGNTIIVFEGRQYNQFLHNFATGKLFIRRNIISTGQPTKEQADAGQPTKEQAEAGQPTKEQAEAGQPDIIVLLSTNSVLINIGAHSIDKKCHNASISFKLDNMYMTEDDIRNISECLVSNMTAYSSVDVSFKNDKFIKKNSYNMLFIIETNACIKKIPLLISVQDELDE